MCVLRRKYLSDADKLMCRNEGKKWVTRWWVSQWSTIINPWSQSSRIIFSGVSTWTIRDWDWFMDTNPSPVSALIPNIKLNYSIKNVVYSSLRKISHYSMTILAVHIRLAMFVLEVWNPVSTHCFPHRWFCKPYVLSDGKIPIRPNSCCIYH